MNPLFVRNFCCSISKPVLYADKFYYKITLPSSYADKFNTKLFYVIRYIYIYMIFERKIMRPEQS